MSDVVIKVSNLSKAYRIGLREQQYDTLGAVISSWVRSPIRNFKRLRSLSNIHDQEESPDIFWALKDVNFEVKRGEVLGIIGKNGAGKSTLLKILSRITEPTRGRVEIYGRVASLLEVGTGFNPELTGRENIYLNGTILGMTKNEVSSKFDDIVAFSGVEKFIDTPVKRYSSGMKVRLAFAVAAHLDPEILIIDEVLAVGDAEFQKKCLGKIQEISKNDSRTVLFVSHDLTAIQNLTQVCILLESGMAIDNGLTQVVVDKYLSKVSDIEQSGFVNLTNVKRQGDGPIRFSSITLMDAANNIVTSIGCGQALKIKINFDPSHAINLKSVQLDIRIKDSLQHPIATVSSRFDRNFENLVLKKNELVCEISKLAMVEDFYSFDFWLSYNNGLADFVKDAIVLSVRNLDYFGTGQIPVKAKHGSILVDHFWQS